MAANKSAKNGVGRMVAGIGCLLALLAWVGPALAESDFQKARELAFSGQREEAREVLKQILAEKPEHIDARVLLGRTYSWDKRFDEARKELALALQQKPGYSDARSALVDVEMWSDNDERALVLLNTGLARDPTNPEFLYKKAQVLQDLEREDEAEKTVDQLLAVHPAHAGGHDLYSILRQGRARQSFEVQYTYNDVSTSTDPWQDVALSYKRRTGFGTVIGRVNIADRFDRTGTQLEFDAYPHISEGVYAYLNYGYSSDSLFPENRFGAELYFGLPASFELSLGARELDFTNSDVTIYTGTIAKYFGSWWISLRPYYTPKDVGSSRSATLFVRRYLGDVDSFIEFSVGTGTSPDDIQTTEDLPRLDSNKIGARLEKKIGDFYVLELKVNWREEDLPFGRERREVEFGVGLERYF